MEKQWVCLNSLFRATEWLHRSTKAWWAQHRAQRWFMCTSSIAAFWMLSCLGCSSPEKLLLKWKAGKPKIFTWEMRSDCICMGNLDYMAQLSNLAPTWLLVGAFSHWLLGLYTGEWRRSQEETSNCTLSPSQSSSRIHLYHKTLNKILRTYFRYVVLCRISSSSLLTATFPTSIMFSQPHDWCQRQPALWREMSSHALCRALCIPVLSCRN